MPRFVPFVFEVWTMGLYGVCIRTEPDPHLKGFDAVKFADYETTNRVTAAALSAGYTRIWDKTDYRYISPLQGN